MREIDTLIFPHWVIPIEPDDRVLQHHAVAVDKGRILDVLPSEEAQRNYKPRHEHRLPHHALTPGLINAHTHAAMALFRGLADDLPLMTWLNDHVWPAEAKWLSEEFVAESTRLALAEMIRGGTTCFNDMYFFPEITARIAAHTGMRAVIGLIVIDFPSVWGSGPDDYFAKATELHDRYRQHPLIRTAFAPHAPYTVSDGPLKRVRTLADELDIPVHMHVHETADEVREGLDKFGVRPIARLDSLGLVGPSLVAVHMTQVDDEELALFARANAHVVHCPESNLKLASGFCPVARMLDAGINVCLGTDGVASNNDLDMIGELRVAALLAKGVAGDASKVPAYQALRMATINGAKALGLAGETGSIEIGKAADLVAVNLEPPATSPVYSPISQLVYAASRDQVTNVWVGGQLLLREGQLTTLDQEAIAAQIREWQQKISNAPRN